MLRQFAFAAVAIFVSACGLGPGPTAMPLTEPGSSPAASDRPTPTVDPVVAIAAGPWRRQPVQPSEAMTGPVEDACRRSEPAIGALPVALADLRGESALTLVFADGPSGYACWSVPGRPADVTVVRLEAPAKPVDGIDVAHYELVATPRQRSMLIGRVGPISQPRKSLGGSVPARIVAGFTNETFVWAAYTDPWYAMWWPGAELTDGVAIVNGRNEVITTVNPELPAQ